VDDWHIRIEKRYLDPAAGSGARAKADELAAGKGAIQRIVERFTDARTEDRGWRRGAEGEERVAAILARCLDERWFVVHDLTIGAKGANLDHLLIGPAGVFTLNTKNLSGRLTVYDRAILQNGTKTAFVPSALREARKVQERLSVATGRDVTAWSVIVLAGRCEVHTKKRPADLTIVTAAGLPRWIGGLPGGKLTPGEVLRLERAARDPETWRPRRGGSGGSVRVPASPKPRGPAPAEVASPPEPSSATPPAPPRPPDSTVTGGDAYGGVHINRWKRYGKDRLYANASDGTKLGYIEVATGEVVLEVADSAGVVAAQLRAARCAVAD
jgi:hypothetical protein